MLGLRVRKSVNWAHPTKAWASLYSSLSTSSYCFHTASDNSIVQTPSHSRNSRRGLSTWRTRRLQRHTFLPYTSPSLARDFNLNLLSPAMSLRRSHSSKGTEKNSLSTNGFASHKHESNGDHSHSHSLFGSHSHSHGEGHGHGAEKIMEAIRGSGDRGSQITLIGLFCNVGLTTAKGLAGWYMHSASLLADAGHSMSDLLGDFVVLFCWKLSRKPPSESYPYGFAKWETLGTTTVSLLLIGGALGIGFHSYHLLVEALNQTAPTLPPGPLNNILENVTSMAQNVPKIGLGHTHGSIDQLDPNAAWFAAVSVLAKEWLYRITKKVADEEKSPVLLANAIHHRSDAYSSVVALFAILGNWFYPALPLDPIGGVLVSIVILKQGLGLFTGAFGDLTDAGVSPKTRQSLIRALDPLVSPSQPPFTTDSASLPNGNHISPLLAISHLRAKRAGSLMFVDLTADVSGTLSVEDASLLDDKITETLKKARREIGEVRVKFHPVDGSTVSHR